MNRTLCIMQWNYVKIAWRIIQKNLGHSLVNIIGLGLGFSAAILMLIYVHHQLSFDRFHENSDRIYRFVIEGSMTDGKTISGALTLADTGPTVIEEIPEADHFTRFYFHGANEVVIDEKRFTDDRIAWVDSVFFSMFSFPLLHGNPETALLETNSIVLSQSVSKKYFEDTNPIGQVIKVGERDYQITAIMKDVPANSHLQFDMLASFHTLETADNNVVANQGISFATYLMMQPGTHYDDFATKIVHSADTYTNNIFNVHGIHISHALQPLSKAYLFSDFHFDNSGKIGDIRNVYVFSFLAFIVILVAVFNFVNLVTAQSEKRAREIGMRKVMGAVRKNLIAQFIGESLIITFLAFVFSLLLNELFIESFSALLDINLGLIYYQKPLMLVAILGFVVIIGIMAGFYPALYLSHYEPVHVLKGGIMRTAGSNNLRKVLVVLQFTVSVFLISSVLLLNRQVQFMKHKDLGFDREHVISVQNLTPAIRSTYQSLKAELLQHPDIMSVTASQSVPGENRSLQNSFRQGDDPSTAVMMYENRVQQDFLQTFGMQIEEGRDFDQAMRTDTASFILNREAVRRLNLENPIGAKINVWQQSGTVIGVVSDYNFMSLRNDIDPLAITMYADWFNRISIRVTPGTTKETLQHTRNVFESADPNYVFDYFFVDEQFAKMYRKEEKTNTLITYASILAIIISFMGLYALTSFTVMKRVKEIAIRKTLGASVTNIMGLLFSELFRWLLIGNLIAWPLAYYTVTRWQENFAFRINIIEHWYYFVLAGVLAALAGMFASIIQVVTAARTNPAVCLKAE
jgi:putative ABC transport system permease protein